MATLNFPISSASPWTAPNGVIYTWNAEGYWEAKGDPLDNGSAIYLQLDGTNGPVTGDLALDNDLSVGDNLTVTNGATFNSTLDVASNVTTDGNLSVKGSATLSDSLSVAKSATFASSVEINDYLNVDGNTTVGGTGTFTGLTTHQGGVRVSGGSIPQIPEGMLRTGSGLLALRTGGAYSILINSDQEIGLGGSIPTTGQQVRLTNDFASGDSFGYYNGCNIADGVTSASYVRSYLSANISAPLTVSSIKLFDAAHPNAGNISSDLTVTNMYGFYSEVTPLSRFTNSYNFYAAGSAPNYFAGLVESAGGFQVSGTNTSVNDGLVRYNNGSLGLVSNGVGAFRISQASGKEGYVGFYTAQPQYPLTFRLEFDNSIERYCDFTPTNQGTATNAANITSSWVQDTGSAIDNAIIYNALSGVVDGTTKNITGFRVNRTIGKASTVGSNGFVSDLNIETGVDNYNFYAEGTAPNYLRGYLVQGPYLGWDGTAGNLPPWTDNWQTDTSHDCTLINSGVTVSRYLGAQDYAFANLASNLRGANASHVLFKRNGAIEGAIRSNDGSVVYTTDAGGTPAFVELGDARNRTFTAFTGNATDTVKLLQPKANGFNPAELQGVVSNAVVGTQDATQAIGTLADYDGTVLETEVAEPSAEELTYTVEVVDELQPTIEGEEPRMVEVTRTKTWSPTGTQPVYQGVDQTKLIPLLTKALQEALERIEALEAAAAGPTKSRAKK